MLAASIPEPKAASFFASNYFLVEYLSRFVIAGQAVTIASFTIGLSTGRRASSRRQRMIRFDAAHGDAASAIISMLFGQEAQATTI